MRVPIISVVQMYTVTAGTGQGHDLLGAGCCNPFFRYLLVTCGPITCAAGLGLSVVSTSFVPRTAQKCFFARCFLTAQRLYVIAVFCTQLAHKQMRTNMHGDAFRMTRRQQANLQPHGL